MSSRQAAKRRIGVKPAEAARAAPRRPLSNAEIADHFYRMAELLELRGGDIFRVLAYRRAAGVIQAMPETIDRFLARGRDLAELPHIGETLAAQIRELCTTGKLSAIDRAEAELPPETVALSSVPGLGPKRLRLLREGLGVVSVDGLRRAISSGSVAALRGFGPGFEARLRQLLQPASRRDGA